MLNTVFVVATWLIGALGVVGALVVVGAVIYLTPAIALPAIANILGRFIKCAWCIAAIVFVLATVNAYWVGRLGEYSRGHTAAIAEIAAGDAKAIAAATEKRNAWKLCRARGAQWDQTTGACS